MGNLMIALVMLGFFASAVTLAIKVHPAYGLLLLLMLFFSFQTGSNENE